MSIYFRINAPHVVSETIDGEAIVINLQSGCYYSLRGSGAEIWALVASHGSPDAIVAALSTRYEPPHEPVAAAVAELVERLQQEGLIVVDEAPAGARALAAATASSERRRRFEAPDFAKYQDLQDMLLADPIHEVGEGGWPTQLPPDARASTPTDGSST